MAEEIDTRSYKERLIAAGCTFEHVREGAWVIKEGYEKRLITPHDMNSDALRVTRYYETPLKECK